MAGYAGTDLQQQRQRSADDNHAWTMATPGACNVGRMLGCDDVAAIGWHTVLNILERDGIVGFRLIDAAEMASLATKLGEAGYRVDTWDVFIAERPEAAPRTAAILAQGLPDGLQRLDLGDDPTGAPVRQLQDFMLANGVVPFSGSMLLGQLGPAATIAIADGSGTIVAAAHSYMPHNAHSRHRGKAWGGLVAVAPSQRGKKLGNYVNAAIVEAAFSQLGADGIYELVSATNIPSRRMVESCGLHLDPNLLTGAATSDSQKYTT